MNRSAIDTLLQSYKKQRGWGRFFFGNTKGIKELTALYNTLPSGELSEETLDRITWLINARAERLVKRRDNYDTDMGVKKATNKIYKSLQNLVSEAKKEYAPTTYNDPLYPHKLIKKNRLLVTAEGEHFDVISLFEALMKNERLTNPITQKLLPETTLESLRKHSLIAKRFVNFEQALLWVQSAMVDFQRFVTRMDIDPRHNPGFMETLVLKYRCHKVDKASFMKYLNILYQYIQDAIKVKSNFSDAEEALFQSKPWYKSLVQIVNIQNYFSFENVDKNIFWEFVINEYSAVLRTRLEGSLRTARSVIEALKSFDDQPEYWVRQAYDYNPIRHESQWGSEYVVRSSEIEGQKNGVLGLKNIVGNFKGVFFNAFRYDCLGKLYDSLDNSGVCLGEKTRAIAAWGNSLLNREPGTIMPTINELFAGYQVELTNSKSSQKFFYSGMSAVDFIWDKHKHEKFTYQDQDGNEQEATLTKAHIQYYLRNIMCDDDVPEVDTPEIFQTSTSMRSAF